MKTGIKTIIAGVTLFVLGAVVVPLAIVLPIVLGEKNKEQFVIPGSTHVAVEEAGRYYLWNDYQTVFKGKSYIRSEAIPDGLEITIKNEKTGEPYNFVSDSSISSSSGTSSKKAIGYIEVLTPGTVCIEILGGDEERIFSFSRSILLAMFGLILGGFGLSMILGLSGVALLIWGIVKLVRSNRESEPSAEAMGYRRLSRDVG